MSTQSDIFLNSREAADELVEEKLARYTDDTRTQLAITNYGKYGLLKGGHEAYLRESEKGQKAKNIMKIIITRWLRQMMVTMNYTT